MTTTVASLQAIFGADTTQFDNAVGRVRAGLSGVGEAVGGTLQRVGGGMQSAGAKIALGIAPLVAFGAQGIRTATQFDSALAEISARTGLFGEDLAALLCGYYVPVHSRENPNFISNALDIWGANESHWNLLFVVKVRLCAKASELPAICVANHRNIHGSQMCVGTIDNAFCQ